MHGEVGKGRVETNPVMECVRSGCEIGGCMPKLEDYVEGKKVIEEGAKY